MELRISLLLSDLIPPDAVECFVSDGMFAVKTMMPVNVKAHLALQMLVQDWKAMAEARGYQWEPT